MVELFFQERRYFHTIGGRMVRSRQRAHGFDYGTADLLQDTAIALLEEGPAFDPGYSGEARPLENDALFRSYLNQQLFYTSSNRRQRQGTTRRRPGRGLRIVSTEDGEGVTIDLKAPAFDGERERDIRAFKGHSFREQEKSVVPARVWDAVLSGAVDKVRELAPDYGVEPALFWQAYSPGNVIEVLDHAAVDYFHSDWVAPRAEAEFILGRGIRQLLNQLVLGPFSEAQVLSIMADADTASANSAQDYIDAYQRMISAPYAAAQAKVLRTVYNGRFARADKVFIQIARALPQYGLTLTDLERPEIWRFVVVTEAVVLRHPTFAGTHRGVLLQQLLQESPGTWWDVPRASSDLVLRKRILSALKALPVK